MKKTISSILAVLISMLMLTGCIAESDNQSRKLSVVTTIFPEYDWVLNVLGATAEKADVTLLLDKSVDLHSFQPTADDIIRISDCDLFIYVGGESDAWAEDALQGTVNKDMVVINLLDVLGDSVKEEEVVEGMETEEHDYGYEEEHDEEHKHDHEVEYDEHVWLSLKNAVVLVGAIRDALVELDPENTDTYTSNAAAYVGKLNELDAAYAETADAASVKTVLFGDRFPFRYLADDYGLDYYAAFVGCSAESEASFETIVFLAGKVDQLGLSTVLTLEGTNHRIAETVVLATKSRSAKILSMDSMQSITAEDIKRGVTYLSIMENNLQVLKGALK